MFLAKAVRDAKNENFCNEFFLWELDKEVNVCRDCSRPFSVAIRRHHCRHCGGIFCDGCSVVNVELGGVKMDRCCKSCVRGETPGDNVRGAIEKSLSIFDTRGNRKVSAANIPLMYGSPFENTPSSPRKEAASPRKESSSPRSAEASSPRTDTVSGKGGEAPSAGYFEFANKLGVFCCVKLFSGGDSSDVASLWEIPRPSYIAVPPNGLVSGRFDSSQPFIELVILMGNPNPPEAGEVVYDTSQNPGKASKCAAVANFRRYMIFRIDSAGRNVLLKFKGDTLLEPRLGNSVGRVGIFGKLGMKSAEDNKDVINFDTNIAASAIRLFCASSL